MSLVTKKCSQCQRDLPHFMFAASSKSPDGMRPNCRDCDKKYSAKKVIKARIKKTSEVRNYCKLGF